MRKDLTCCLFLNLDVIDMMKDSDNESETQIDSNVLSCKGDNDALSESDDSVIDEEISSSRASFKGGGGGALAPPWQTLAPP